MNRDITIYMDININKDKDININMDKHGNINININKHININRNMDKYKQKHYQKQSKWTGTMTETYT